MQAVKPRLVRPRCMVDLQAVTELRGVSADGSGVRIGAMTPYAALAEESSLDGAYQALRDAAARVGDRQVRNRGTIGGSLCWNYIAACMPPVALALGMEMALSGKGGERSLAAEDFLGGPLETAREDDEILVSLNLPAAPAATGSAYKKWGQVTDALPVVGVCVLVTLDGNGRCEQARIALAGLADGTQRAVAGEAALVGSDGDPASVDAAMSTIAEAADTHSDLSADADYRKNLIRTLGRTVSVTAFERARA